MSIQLFRQRSSHKSVKAYATMPIGIIGSKSLALLDWGSRQFSKKERERTNTCLCCFLPPRGNTLRFTQATLKTTITHGNFRHCRVSFSPIVRQPFSKQLYTTGLQKRLEIEPTGHVAKTERGRTKSVISGLLLIPASSWWGHSA